jgi:hypothetical protein
MAHAKACHDLAEKKSTTNGALIKTLGHWPACLISRHIIWLTDIHPISFTSVVYKEPTRVGQMTVML